MNKLLKEPFIHFLLLGAALFALNAWRGKSISPSLVESRIDVTAAVIEQLRAGHERQFGRSPDAEELRGLVAAHIREEVLYREALKMGLDRDDTIVRRRMAQKMEFLTDDVVSAPEPDDTALRHFFAANAARYEKPARVTFRHIYFSKEKRGADTETAAKEALVMLAKGANEESFGDSFLHGFEFIEQEPADITALFGNEFSANIATLREGDWSKPIASSYGLHLIYVTHRGEPRPTPLNEVRDAVVRDFTEERRRTANHDIFEKLRGRYRVAVDDAALANAVAPRTAQK